MDLEYIGGFKAPEPKKRVHHNAVMRGGTHPSGTSSAMYGGSGPLLSIAHPKFIDDPNYKPDKHQISSGTQGGKKQTKFKRKVGSPVHKVGKETDKMIKQMGAKVGDSMAKIRADLSKERVKFRANTNKAGTQVKKMERRTGTTKKASMQEANRFKDALKADLKRLIAQATLKAIKEFNNKLK